MKRYKLMNRGITLIALIITIIVLLILAGVTIGFATSNGGIIGRAKQTSETWQQDSQNESEELGRMENAIDNYQKGRDPFDEEQKLNRPQLKTGMTPVKFEKDSNGIYQVKTTTEDDKDWYNYAEKRWANARTEDGSMWVWIPRYAYRVNASTKTMTIQFLKGTTDTYIDENGEAKSDIKRCKTATESVDTTTGLTVHPAFTDESSIGYRNGGWDSELLGFWVAKYEAAFTDSNNVKANKVKVSSGLNYIAQQYYYWDGTNQGWKDTVTNYEGQTIGVNQTKDIGITYPTFQPNSYSYNYICHNDAFNLCEKLTQRGNIYGLSSSNTESHVIKNSEWGAVAYLGQSSYGLGSTDIAINNYNDTAHKGVAQTKTGYNDKSQKWNEGGATASNTGTVYGIYDMSGGLWCESPAYINNGSAYLQKYGQSILGADGNESSQSSKHKTVYPGTSAENTLIYGDAGKETSRLV